METERIRERERRLQGSPCDLGASSWSLVCPSQLPDTFLPPHLRSFFLSHISFLPSSRCTCNFYSALSSLPFLHRSFFSHFFFLLSIHHFGCGLHTVSIQFLTPPPHSVHLFLFLYIFFSSSSALVMYRHSYVLTHVSFSLPFFYYAIITL